MIRLNIHEAKTHLSRYLVRIERGESILLCRRNVPIAEIKPLSQEPRRPGRPGRWTGEFDVTEAFFDPLPEDLMDAFEGAEPDR